MTAYTQQQAWNQQPMQQMQMSPMQPQVYPPQPYQPRFVPQAVQMQMQQPQMQQPQQPQQQSIQIPQNAVQSVPVYGRYINCLKDISAGEVPMDKNYYFFPTFDMSTIYAKHWDDNGKLQTYMYVYQPDDAEIQPQQQDFNSIILERLNRIEEMLTSTKQNQYKKKSYHKTNPNTDQVKEQDNAVPNADA